MEVMKMRRLMDFDPELAKVLADERQRQNDKIEAEKYLVDF